MAAQGLCILKAISVNGLIPLVVRKELIPERHLAESDEFLISVTGQIRYVSSV